MLTNQDSDVDIRMRRRYSQSLKPCELQKLIKNHQFSFCWIYLLLLTWLTMRLSYNKYIQIKLRWALFVTYTITQHIMRCEMCSLHLTHPSGAVGSRHCSARGAVWGSVPCSRVSPQSWTLPAGAGIRTHNLGLPRVSSPKTIRPRLTTFSSLGITGIPLRWFEYYLTDRFFKVAWGGEVSTEHQLVTGVPQGSILGPLLFSTYTTSLGPIIQAHGFSYHFYADDTQLYLLFRPDDPTVAARISGCLADISAWMKEHHLQLNLAKTELLVFPATPTLQHDFTIQLGSSTITPSSSVRNMGVIFDN